MGQGNFFAEFGEKGWPKKIKSDIFRHGYAYGGNKLLKVLGLLFGPESFKVIGACITLILSPK